jgi:4-hydroxy-tetrahydrodipicolinate synthase
MPEPVQRFVIDGVVPIIPTPFNAAEEVDWVALARLVNFACVSGAAAVCLPAYGSEFYKLSGEERQRTIAEAVEEAEGRLPVIGQINAPGRKLAVETARSIANLGADAIGITIPRLFATAEEDIERYLSAVFESAALPFIVQDFNPGGPTLSTSLIARLSRRFPQFRYVKLEEAMMGPKITAIREATEDKVGVLEGWGGMFMLELYSLGIRGVVPGLAISDLLGLVHRHLRAGRKPEAYQVFQDVLPQIVFSLQNLEFFHHAEKRLLVARGLLEAPVVRELALTPSANDLAHIDFLNARILDALAHYGLEPNPKQLDEA